MTQKAQISRFSTEKGAPGICGELRCRETGRIAPQDTREADAGARNRRRKEREDDEGR